MIQVDVNLKKDTGPNKTIVFDIDETILTTKDRDFINSEPIKPVVKKMEILKQHGWKIVLHTARGMGRSEGAIEDVYTEVEKEIKHSLEKHQIPYDELILGKTWAALYVDDKAMTPEIFVESFDDIIGGVK